VSESAPGFWSRVRSGGLIAIVTLVIWLLAESESLRTEKVRVEVQFGADPATNRLVSTVGDFNGTVTVRLQGSNARVDALAAALRKSIRLEPGMEGVSADPGEHAVNLEAALRALPLVRDSAVSLSEVEPATVTILVDSLVTRDIAVKVVIPEGQVVDGAPEASPATVQVTYPKSAARDLPPEATAIARLDASSLAQLPDGRRGTLNNILLELPEPVWSMEGVKLTPAQVSVTVRLRSRVDVYTIPSAPVQLRLPVEAAGKYDLDTDTTELKDIAVVGPLDLIAQIKSGRLVPVATIPLSAQELEQAATSRQVLTKEPVFSDIPTPLSFDTKQKVIRVLVRKRETPSSSVPR
jgi:hypothetical protein